MVLQNMATSIDVKSNKIPMKNTYTQDLLSPLESLTADITMRVMWAEPPVIFPPCMRVDAALAFNCPALLWVLGPDMIFHGLVGIIFSPTVICYIARMDISNML